MKQNEIDYIERHAARAFEEADISPMEWPTFKTAYFLGFQLAQDDAADAGPRWNDNHELSVKLDVLHVQVDALRNRLNNHLT